MQYPTDEDIFRLMTDFKRDFGSPLPFEDARRLLVLYDEICDIFEKHNVECQGEQEFVLD